MSQISHSDWNPLVSSVQGVLTGWGQTHSSYAVATGNTVNHADWNALVADINKCYTHITGSNSSLSTVVTGTRITQANLTNASAAVTYINTNQYSIASTQYTQNTLYDSGYQTFSPWQNYYIANYNINWSSFASYNQFWNAGGGFYINLSGISSGSSQSQSWVDLFANMGAFYVLPTSIGQQGQTWSGTYPGGNVGPLNGFNTTPTTYFQLYNQDTNYTANYLQIQFNTNGTQLQMSIILQDAHAGIAGGYDYVDGQARLVVTQRYPFGNPIQSLNVASQSQS